MSVLALPRDVWAALTWRRLAAAGGLALLIQLEVLMRFGPYAPPKFWISSSIIVSIAAFGLLVAILAAEQIVARGAPAWLTWPIALALGAAASGASQFFVRHWFGLYTVVDRPGVPYEIRLTQAAYVTLDGLVYGIVMAVIYIDNRQRQRALLQVRDEQLKQTHNEQMLVQSQLATARATVDPAALFEELTLLRNKLDSGAADAVESLDETIARLRLQLTPAPT